MSVSNHAPGSLTNLSDTEREILGLLTAGHTVKSIAVSLGRSEASINERLRDARRKTGVGSSRELARLLDAQKNRDRKIDLTPQHSSVDQQRRPSIGTIARSKGTLIMITAITLALGALTMTVAEPGRQPVVPQSVHAKAPQKPPLVGTWSLDVKRIPAAERPQRVTMAFRQTADGKWTGIVDIVAPDGSTQHAEGTAATDGVPVPIKGNIPSIDTVSMRQPSPNTLVMTFGKNGKPVSTRVYTVSRNRNSMTETIVWAGSTIPGLETTYFARIG